MENAVKSTSPTIKVCVICGVVGDPQKLVTCRRCRKASKHFYCMPVVQPQIPYSWCCEECEESVQNMYDGQKSVKSYHPFVVGEKKVHRILGSLSPPHAALKNRNTIKDGRSTIKGFPSDKFVMQSSLRDPSPKVAENAKVKYISPEEVVLAHSRAHRGQRNLGSSWRPSDNAKGTYPHISRKPVGNSNTFKLPVSKHFHNAQVDASLNKFNERRETVTSYKGTKENLEKTLGCPSSNFIRPNMSNYIDAPPLDTGDMSRGKAAKALPEPIMEDSDKRCSDNEVNYSLVNIGDVNSKCADSGSTSTKEKDEKLQITGLLGLTCSDARSKDYNLQDISLPKELLTDTAEGALNYLALGVCWKGNFEVYDAFCQTNTGIQAYYSRERSSKAYEMLKRFPLNFKLKIVPRVDAWPKLFQLAAPNHEDIGLFFLPAECDRSKEKYTDLLFWIDAHDFALRTTIGDAELLIYSSTQLTVDSRRLGKQTYLWGVFLRTKKRKCDVQNLENSLVAAGTQNFPAQFSGTSEAQDEVDMEIDMIGGVEVGPVDIYLPNRNCPPGFQRQIYRHADHP